MKRNKKHSKTISPSSLHLINIKLCLQKRIKLASIFTGKGGLI